MTRHSPGCSPSTESARNGLKTEANKRLPYHSSNESRAVRGVYHRRVRVPAGTSAVGRHYQSSEGFFIGFLLDEMHGALNQSGITTVWEMGAELRQRLIRCIDQILWFRPGDCPSGLDNEQGEGDAVTNLRDHGSVFASEQRS